MDYTTIQAQQAQRNLEERDRLRLEVDDLKAQIVELETTIRTLVSFKRRGRKAQERERQKEQQEEQQEEQQGEENHGNGNETEEKETDQQS